MSETSNRPKPSGWYPDPEDAARLRTWDGVGWAESWMAAPGARRPPDAGPVGTVVDGGSATAEGLDLISAMRTLTWLSFASSLASLVAAALAALVVYRLTAGLRPVEYLEPAE